MRWRFLLLLFGITLVVLGYNELTLWRVADHEPQVLTCRELRERGPGRNAHVVLRDAVLCADAFVFEARDGKWLSAWVPAVPADSDYARRLQQARERGDDARLPPPTDIAVLVMLRKARTFDDVQQAARLPHLQGLVVNGVEPLRSAEQTLLAQQYPGVDFARCWILELDRRPASIPAIVGCFAGGVLLLLFLVRTLVGGAPAPVAPPAH